MIKQYQWMFALVIGMSSITLSSAASAGGLVTAAVTQSGSESVFTAEGVVEAVKSSLIAPQVAGGITTLTVKAGDHVKAGQLLARIDTRLAAQQAMTTHAQVAAAQAQLSAARKEYERKQRLYEKQYISQASLERAESDYKTAEAQTKAQLAQTGAASVQTGLHTINAPYSGVIAEVMTEVGDMAMPGKPLLSVYDPKEFRVVVNVPQSQIANLQQIADIKVLIASASEAERTLSSMHMTVLPTVDAISNMAKVRLSLPSNLTSLAPGMFARALLPVSQSGAKGHALVPAIAVIKRSELMAVYVVDKQGRPQLRQVRLGRPQGDNIEVFAGLHPGELVALDPIAAANFQ